VAVATVAGLTTFALAMTLSGVGVGAKIAAWGLLAFGAWRLKENVGRVMDGTEPRVGEDVPMAGKNPQPGRRGVHDPSHDPRRLLAGEAVSRG
jgi:hypothetical protein